MISMLIVGLAVVVFGDEPKSLEAVRLAPDGKGFVLATSGKRYVPLGFNYDHDEQGRLIEDYWVEEWPKVEADFREMAELGANVTRIHLQFGRFMKGPEEADQAALDRLAKLLDLAKECGLHVDLTGLACYHKAEVPAWYDALDEEGRWAAQERFWEAVAARCNGHPAVFCYDLMNEPVVPGGKRKPGDWLGPAFGDKTFVQFVTLDQAGRSRPEVARAWVERTVGAIRRHDKEHLVTVGLVDWSLDRPGLTSGFVPKEVAGPLDFLCVHLYPKSGKAKEGIETLEGFAAAGKPVVIEETFPLGCSADELDAFLEEAEPLTEGVIGFYWGKTPAEMTPAKTIPDALTLGWLELFQRMAAGGR